MIYQEVQTKTAYRELVNSLIMETEKLVLKFPEIPMYLTILEQLKDIVNQIQNNVQLTEYEVDQRYSLGAIAVKNFDSETDLYGRKLEDAFGALSEYWDLPVD